METDVLINVQLNICGHALNKRVSCRFARLLHAEMGRLTLGRNVMISILWIMMAALNVLSTLAINVLTPIARLLVETEKSKDRLGLTL